MGEVTPGAHEVRSLWQTRVVRRLAQAIAAILRVTHEAMTVAHDLGASESLEAAHVPRAPFEVLVVALDDASPRLAS